MGNILDQSFEKVWNGKEYRRLRKRLFGGDLPPACRKCASRLLYKGVVAEQAYAEIHDPKYIQRPELYEISE